MIVPGGAETFSEALRIARRGLPHAEDAAPRARPRDRRRRRGRLRARPRLERGGDRRHPRGSRPRGPRRPDRDRARPGDDRVLRDGAYHVEGRELATDGMRRLLGASSPTATRSSPSRTRSPRTTGTPGGSLTERLGDRVQLVGDDLFVTNVERLAARHRGGRRERDPRQGQPDRHAHARRSTRSRSRARTATRP